MPAVPLIFIPEHTESPINYDHSRYVVYALCRWVTVLVYTCLYFYPRFRIWIHWFRIHHFRLNTKPDPDPEFWWPKIMNFKDEKIDQKLQFIYPKASTKEVQSYMRSLQPSKENNQHFKTWNFLTFFYFCRIRIRKGNENSSWLLISDLTRMLGFLNFLWANISNR